MKVLGVEADDGGYLVYTDGGQLWRPRSALLQQVGDGFELSNSSLGDFGLGEAAECTWSFVEADKLVLVNQGQRVSVDGRNYEFGDVRWMPLEGFGEPRVIAVKGVHPDAERMGIFRDDPPGKEFVEGLEWTVIDNPWVSRSPVVSVDEAVVRLASGTVVSFSPSTKIYDFVRSALTGRVHLRGFGPRLKAIEADGYTYEYGYDAEANEFETLDLGVWLRWSRPLGHILGQEAFDVECRQISSNPETYRIVVEGEQAWIECKFDGSLMTARRLATMTERWLATPYEHYDNVYTANEYLALDRDEELPMVDPVTAEEYASADTEEQQPEEIPMADEKNKVADAFKATGSMLKDATIAAGVQVAVEEVGEGLLDVAAHAGRNNATLTSLLAEDNVLGRQGALLATVGLLHLLGEMELSKFAGLKESPKFQMFAGVTFQNAMRSLASPKARELRRYLARSMKMINAIELDSLANVEDAFDFEDIEVSEEEEQAVLAMVEEVNNAALG